MLYNILVSFVAGVGGNTIGALISLFVKREHSFVGRALGVASGVMLAVVFFELLPDSMHSADGLILPMLGMCLGGVLMYLSSRLTDAKSSRARHSFASIGARIMIGIAIHNFPEGLAIGGGISIAHSLATAILIGLHNIPEGLAVALPYRLEKGQWYKGLIASALAGVPTIVGAIIGSLVSTTRYVMSLFLALAGGAMLYIVIEDMLPISSKTQKYTSFTVLLGVLIGAIVIYVV